MKTKHPPDRGMAFSDHVVNVKSCLRGVQDRVIGSRYRIGVTPFSCQGLSSSERPRALLHSATTMFRFI